MKNIRIGAINWDAGLPKDTYFGGFALRNLGNDKYKARLPFYAKKHGDDYEIPLRTQEEYDKELMYAIEGGIDFFAFCWYPDTVAEKRTIWKDDERYTYLSEHYPELNIARKLYLKSELKKKIGMCAIMFCINAYAESDFEELIDAMEQDFYEKIDGRPLVIIFGGYNAGFIRIIRQYAGKKGLNPYVAFVEECPDYSRDYSEADAVTVYAIMHRHNINNFDELLALSEKENKGRLNYDMSVIPMMTMGWNPMPRIDFPVPWVDYGDCTYAGQPEEKHIKKSFEILNKLIEANPDKVNTGCALAFAWNEFEEGGYLCPTLNFDGTVNDRFLKSFSKIKKEYTD